MTGPFKKATKRWTVPQLAMLKTMRAAGQRWTAIAMACGHTAGSCATTYSVMLKQREAALSAPARSEPAQVRNKELRRPWSKEDVAELVRLVEAGVPYREIDATLQRSFGGCRTKYETLQRPRASAHQVHPSEPGSHVKVTADALADRDQRKRLQHQSLTAAAFGDPLPGRSALDQKRGVSR